MTRITRNTSSIFFNSQNSAAAPASDTQGPTQQNNAVSLVSLGKRPTWFANSLTNQAKRSKQAGPGSKDEIKKEIEQWLKQQNKTACESLAEHICRKSDASDRSSAATRKAVEKLVSEWSDSTRHILNINSNNLLAKKRLIMTRLLVKIVQSQEFTFEDACEALRTMCVPTRVIKYLTDQAQAYCRGLGGTVSTASSHYKRRLSKDPCNLMVLGALHDELVSRAYGYKSADVIEIAKHDPGALLLLASDIMNQHPFISENAGNEPPDADQVSMARKVNIARYEGSTTTIFTVLKHFAELQQRGFLPDQVLKMAGQARGSNIIDAVLKNHDALISKNFNNEHIVMIAGVSGGNLAIERTAKHADELLELGFTNQQIVRIVISSTGGLRSVQLALKCGDALRKSGECRDQFVSALRPEKSEQEIELLLRNQAGPAAAGETLPEPFSLASPPDAGELQKVLQDESVRAALGLDDQNTQPFSFLGEGASHEQAAQVVRELR